MQCLGGGEQFKYISSTEDKFGNLHKGSTISFPIFEFQITYQKFGSS